jgi:hypothetical protein
MLLAKQYCPCYCKTPPFPHQLLPSLFDCCLLPLRTPIDFKYRMTITMPMTTQKKSSQNVQQMKVRRERFAFWRSSQDSLLMRQSMRTHDKLRRSLSISRRKTDVCLSPGWPVVVELAFCSSSRCTAMEKRFQKEGSRMTAMIDFQMSDLTSSRK